MVRKQNGQAAFRRLFPPVLQGALFVREGLGYLLTFEHLIDTSPDSGLVFRPLTPRLETKLYLIWKKYQVFTPIAEKMLEKLKGRFHE